MHWNYSTFIYSLKHIITNYNNFSGFIVNICNFIANIDELLILPIMINYAFDIIVLSETWINININFTIDWYTLINSLYIITIADGLYILVINNCIIKLFSKNIILDYNSLLMLIFKGEYSYYYLTAINRSPSVSQYFADIIPNSNFICGDINIILITYS